VIVASFIGLPVLLVAVGLFPQAIPFIVSRAF